MTKFASDDIERYLRAVDRHLVEPFTMVVIGGAAAALAYEVQSGTEDIDTVNQTSSIEAACAAARKDTGLSIPLGSSPTWDGPYEYEDRLQPLTLKGLRKLQILVPEKHDWALMKIVRLVEKDLEDLEEVHRAQGLDRDILVKRFLEEMTHVIGDKSEIVHRFATAVETLFGKEEADRIEKEVRRRWKDELSS